MRKTRMAVVLMGPGLWLSPAPMAAAERADCGGTYVACLEQSQEDTGASDYVRCGAEYNECVRRQVIRS